MSNLMALLLQTLAARLGIITEKDLAQMCKERYSKPVCYILWFLCEIAIAATDLAEGIIRKLYFYLIFFFQYWEQQLD